MAATGQNIQNHPPSSYNSSLSLTLQMKQLSQINQQSVAGDSYQYDPAAPPTNIPQNDRPSHSHTSGEWEDFV